MQKKSVKKGKIGNWMGIVGFLLEVAAVVFLILILSNSIPFFYIGSLILLLPVLVLTGLVFSIIQIFKKVTVLSIVSIIFCVIFVLLIIWIIIPGDLGPEDDSAIMCVESKLMIVSANATDNSIMVTRLSGGEDEDVTGVKFTVNGVAAAVTEVDGVDCTDCDLSLGIIETNTFTLGADIQPGDDIAIAAQVGENRIICSISDTKTA